MSDVIDRSTHELQLELRKLAAGQTSLSQFQEWFAAHILENDFADHECAGSVALALAEYTTGHVSVEELREELRQLTAA